MRNKMLIAATIVGFGSIVSTHAHAQNVKGALQLGLGTNFITYTSNTLTYRQQIANGTILETKFDDQTTTWGLGSRNAVELEGGYGLTDNLVLGGMIEFGGWSNPYGPDGSPQRDTNSGFSLFLGPKIDYMFLPDSVVRPFVGGVVGLIRYTNTHKVTDQNNITITNDDLGVTGIALLGRAGIRWFLTPGFSLDPALVLGFATASGSRDQLAGGNAIRSDDAGLTGYTVGLRIGFSGWIGL